MYVGTIPKTRKFTSYLPCPLAHPGYCAEVDRDILTHAKAATKALFAFLCTKTIGTYWHIAVQAEDDSRMHTWLLLCHNRYGSPKLNLVATADLSDDTLALQPGAVDEGYSNAMTISVVAFLFKQVRGVGVKSMHVCQAPEDTSKEMPAEGDVCILLESWQSIVDKSGHRFFPPGHSVPGADRVLSPALKSLDALSSRRRHRASKAPGVTVKGPSLKPKPVHDAADDAPDAPSSDDESSGRSGDSKSSDGSDGPDLAKLCAGAGGGGGGGGGGGADRGDDGPQRRCIQWGPWSISEIWSQRVHTGWGANCGCHFTSGSDLRCKKNIQAIAGCTLDEARCLAKQWLLMGRAIPPGSVTGRANHVLGIQRRDIALRPEAELDSEAARL